MARRLLTALLACLLLVEPVVAATYYVDKDSLGGTCNDTGSGTAESEPWCTLHRALDGNPNNEEGGSGSGLTPIATSGDTVYVKTATYIDIQTDSSHAVGNASFSIPAGVALRAYTPSGCTHVAPDSTCRHKPVLQRRYAPNDYDTDGDKKWAVINFAGDSATLDGFTISHYTGALDGGQIIVGSGRSHLTIENNRATRPGYDGDEGSGNPACGNYSALYFIGPSTGYARGHFNVVRYNVFGGAKRTVNGPETAGNCAAVKLYGQHSIDLYQNRITDSDNGIDYKINNEGGTIRLNYLHNIYERAMRIDEGGGAAVVVSMPTIKHNVFAFIGNPSSSGAIQFGPEAASQASGLIVRNNVFWMAGHATASGAARGIVFDTSTTRDWVGTPMPNYWNNLIVAGDVSDNEGMMSIAADYRADAGDQPPDYSNDGGCLNYNAWAKTDAATGLRIKIGATNITSFATWQGFGASDQYVGTNDRTICSGGTCTHTVADADALIAALFQGTPSATGTDPAVYKPATGGPLDGTGNTLCIGGGSAVHIGAYETGNETIGPPLSAAAATSTRPRPRRGYLLH